MTDDGDDISDRLADPVLVAARAEAPVLADPPLVWGALAPTVTESAPAAAGQTETGSATGAPSRSTTERSRRAPATWSTR